MTPDTFTGWPERSVGLNRAPRAADYGRGLSSGWPLQPHCRNNTCRSRLIKNLHAYRLPSLNSTGCRRIRRLRQARGLTVSTPPETVFGRLRSLPAAAVAGRSRQSPVAVPFRFQYRRRRQYRSTTVADHGCDLGIMNPHFQAATVSEVRTWSFTAFFRR